MKIHVNSQPFFNENLKNVDYSLIKVNKYQESILNEKTTNTQFTKTGTSIYNRRPSNCRIPMYVFPF